MLWEVLAFVNVLDASVIDHDVNAAKFGQSLIDKIFAIDRLGQIGIDIECFNLGILLLEILTNPINLLLVS